MEYFEILDLNREPFSNSPDPDFFFESSQHKACLQKLEIALRLRRGLNIVIGEVGTGKTTLCRQLIRRFAADTAIETHLILDPYYESPLDFLSAVAGMLDGHPYEGEHQEAALKESVKQSLYRKGVDEGKIVILVVDEGQKIPPACLEMMREFLNYETNEHKLLQIVIFAQPEFEDLTRDRANFTDRINLYHRLEPLNFSDTRRLIAFRLRQSSDMPKTETTIFSVPALWAIYRSSGGYPRKIINLCHRSILAMIVQDKTRAGWRLIRSNAKRGFPLGTPRRSARRSIPIMIGLGAVAVFAGSVYLYQRPLADRIDPALLPEPVAPTIAAAVVPADEKKLVSAAASGDAKAETSQPENAHPVTSSSDSTPAAPSNDAPLKTMVVSATNSALSVDESGRVASPDRNYAEPALPTRPPELLGRIAMARGESLWKMIRSVYGSFDKRKFRMIIQANPHLRNPDNVEIGKVINFPAIQTRISSTDIKCWWVRLSREKSLTAAVAVMRNQPEGVPETRVIPYWHPDEGLQFSVVLRIYVFEESRARELLEGLSADGQRGGDLVTVWGDERTVFFADPYMT